MPLVRLDHIDRQAFARDVDALRAEIDASLGPRDYAHLRRFVWAARLCTLLGYATAWLARVNPFSALLLGCGHFVRWAVVMHHVGHRGYDKVPGTPPRYSSRRFARGSRRFIDWLDWMPTEGWLHEHNSIHHARTNEDFDPDLVERNVDVIRSVRAPRVVKYLVIAFFACTWKLTYYMPNVVRSLQMAKARRAGTPSPFDTNEGLRQFYDPWSAEGRTQWWRLLDPLRAQGREYWLHGVLPYGLFRFVLMPALNVLLTSLLAEAFTNVQAFATIVPNHAGDDLARFGTPAVDRAEFYVRQVSSSVNFTSPGAWSDFLQGGLNFQIEHHLWSDLPLSKYREYSGRVQAICERHGVPYRKEALHRRIGKVMHVFLGSETQHITSVQPVREPPLELGRALSPEGEDSRSGQQQRTPNQRWAISDGTD
jgi:fatty acid desaturase